MVQVTHDLTHLCKASLFSQVGKQTPVALRFSTVGGESGSADTARYAVQYCSNVIQISPIFFIEMLVQIDLNTNEKLLLCKSS